MGHCRGPGFANDGIGVAGGFGRPSDDDSRAFLAARRPRDKQVWIVPGPARSLRFSGLPSARSNQVTIALQDLLGDRCPPSRRANPSPRFLPQPSAQWRVIDQATDRRCQCAGISRLDQQTGLLVGNGFNAAGCGRPDDGFAAGSRFEEDQSESLRIQTMAMPYFDRGEHENIASIVERHQFRALNAPDERHVGTPFGHGRGNFEGVRVNDPRRRQANGRSGR